MNQDMRVLKFFLKISALLDLFPKSVFSAFLRPEINFRYGSRSRLKQAIFSVCFSRLQLIAGRFIAQR